MITVGVVLILLSQISVAEDWPMFRHDLEHTGETSDVIENPEDLELKWKFKTEEGVGSSPAVSGDHVYVGSREGYVYCFDKNTGKEIWKFKTGDWADSSPAVSENYVYVGSNDWYIYSLDKNTGKEIWKFKTGSWVGSSPAVSENYVYVGSRDGYVYCFDKNTGKLKWKFKTEGGVGSSPAVSGDYVYVGSGDSYVYCLDKNIGEEIWKFKTGDWADSSPTVSGNYIYVGSKDSYIYCLDKNIGELKWKFKTGFAVYSSPAVSSSYIYVGSFDSSSDGYIYCLDKNTGKEIWKFKTGFLVSISSPTVSGNYIYFGSSDNYTYCLDKNTGNLIWKFKTGDGVSSSPTISGNYVYVGSWDGYVYAFAALKPMDSSCSEDSDCQSNHCVHGVCRTTDTYCGDNYCDSGETYSSCPSDCKKPDGSSCLNASECSDGYCVHSVCRSSSIYCGDGYCDTGETYSSCSKDCEAPKRSNSEICSSNSDCESNRCVHNICRPTDPYCGDDYCDTGEDYDSCPSDCSSEVAEEMHDTVKTTCSSDADCEDGEVCRDIECIGEPFYQPIMPYINYIAAFLVIIVLIVSLWIVVKKLRKPKDAPEPTLATIEKKPISTEKPLSKAKGKIFCRNLLKSYKNTKVLKSVSVEFEEGKIYGIVGPSGCGKSRLVECLIGRITPDSGDVSVFGYDPRVNMKEINEVVGFVPQHPELYPEQTVWQNMQNSAIKWGIADFEKVCSEILKSVDLADRRDVVAKNLSGGQIKRLSLAMELIRDPRVLLLDEPTTGLDPGMRTKIMTILDNLNKRGKTVIFSTHYMDEIDICDEVLIMKNGGLIIKSTVEGLKRKTPGRGRVVEVTLERVGKSLVMELEKDRGVDKIIESGRILRVFTHEPNVAEITNKITKLGGVIEASRITQADMRDLFIYFTDTYPEEE